MSGTLTYRDKFQRKFTVTSTGIVGDTRYDVIDEVHLRVTTENAPAGTTVVIRAALNNEEGYTQIGSVGANETDTLDISTWDRIQLECTVHNGDFDLLATGFHEHPFLDDVGVVVNPTPGEPGTDGGIAEYGSVSALATSTSADIVTYTVPVGKDFFLQSVEYGGENVADYTILVDGSTKAFKRTSHGTYEGSVQFSNLKVTAGKIVKISVIHTRGSTADFEATINGVEV